MIPKPIILLSLTLILATHSAVIDPTAQSLLNSTAPAPPLNSGPSPPPNAYDNVTLDDLSKMIAEMLAQLNQAQQNHTEISQDQNTTVTPPLTIQNSSLTSPKTQISNTSQPISERQLTKPSEDKPTGTSSQASSNSGSRRDAGQQEAVPPNAAVDEQGAGQNTEFNGPNTQNSSPELSLQNSTAANNTTTNGLNQSSNSTINSLLNGNYFTYFVDLNALQTGNIFLNAPNIGQTPISRNSSNSSSNSSNSGSSNNTSSSSSLPKASNSSSSNSSSNSGSPSISNSSSNTNSSSNLPRTNSAQNQSTSSTRSATNTRPNSTQPRNTGSSSQETRPSTTSSKTTESTTKENNPPKTTTPTSSTPTTNKLSSESKQPQPTSPAGNQSSTSTQTNIQPTLLPPSYSPNLNRYDLCQSDFDCLSFLQLGNSGLKAVCNMGICRPQF